MNTAKIASNPALKAFVDLYVPTTASTDAVEQAGYVDLPDDQIEATRSAWESAVGLGSSSPDVDVDRAARRPVHATQRAMKG